MRNFEFTLMELLQRTDSALRQEQQCAAPNLLALAWLKLRRDRLTRRLRRSITQPQLMGG